MTTETFEVPVGPLHVALEEPMYFKLDVRGDTIQDVDIFAGHLHRGIEQIALNRNFFQCIILTERLCSLCSNSHPATYCMAVENIAGIEIPPRARYIRVIAEEVKRIASNTFNVSLLAHLVGFDTLFMHLMELREIVQDIKEVLWGNRMNLGVNVIGGVRVDLDHDKITYLKTRLDELEPQLREGFNFIETHSSIARRTKGVGILDHDHARRYGVVGPVARAAGVGNDVRVTAPYYAFPELEMEQHLLPDGDVYSRAVVRAREVLTAISLVRQCVDRLPKGDLGIGYMPHVPVGESVARSEAPRGELIYYLRTDGSDGPARVKWRVPSYPNWEALRVMLRQADVADAAIIIGSIDPCIACTER
ncbi:nickel-dependent hydrogenase large subunit [Pseudovibrio sp. POLY-S9]|uniref:hydrogenase large subunit n=1 Tax=Pseudovibrio sp. POLY-S9 TaxID=1576596 RepID=UPI00070A0F83|nr:nickel-dependent hydrogenase large subunit [Pseudovibrio sp. POLY-S9]